MNRITLIGRAGSNAEVDLTKGGTSVAKFSIATAKPKKMEDGSTKYETTWHRIVAFGATADRAAADITKGCEVFCEGEQQHREYDGKDGQRKTFSEVVAFTVKALKPRAKATNPVGPMESDMDDIPL